MRVYIAGPMTSIPLANFPAFDAARDRWSEAGHDVVSPADITRAFWREHFREEFDPANPDPSIWAGGEMYERFLREDLRAITGCEAIALLPGWQRSAGVARELAVSRALRLPEYDAETLEPMPEETILQEAHRLVHGDRGTAYGHPLDDYSRTGMIWGGLLYEWAQEAGRSPVPVPVPAELAILCMIGVKMSREVNKRKRDNRVDIVGYAECLDMTRRERARRENAA